MNNASAETRQQRRFKQRQEKKGAPKPHTHPYRRALEQFKTRAETLKAAAALTPLLAKLAMLDLAAKLGVYKSRGHGRGTASRNYMRPYANSVGGDGLRERTRRCVGGFARVQRDLGLSSRAAMDVIYLTGKRAKYPQSFRALEKIVAAVEAARG